MINKRANASKSKKMQKDIDFDDSRRKKQLEMTDIIEIKVAYDYI